MTKRSDEITLFVERMKRERSERGLPPTITDPGTLNVIAALVAHRKEVEHDRAA